VPVPVDLLVFVGIETIKHRGVQLPSSWTPPYVKICGYSGNISKACGDLWFLWVHIPFGKHTNNYGKSRFFMCKSTN
jgi:hypothetical protein